MSWFLKYPSNVVEFRFVSLSIFPKNLLNIASMSSCVCPTIINHNWTILKTPLATSNDKYANKYLFLFSPTQLSSYNNKFSGSMQN